MVNPLWWAAFVYTCVMFLAEVALIVLASFGHPIVLLVVPYPLFGTSWAWKAVTWRRKHAALLHKFLKLSESVGPRFN